MYTGFGADERGRCIEPASITLPPRSSGADWQLVGELVGSEYSSFGGGSGESQRVKAEDKSVTVKEVSVTFPLRWSGTFSQSPEDQSLIESWVSLVVHERMVTNPGWNTRNARRI